MSEKITHGAVAGTDDAAMAAAIAAVAAAQDELVAELVGLGTTMCNAMDAIEGFVPCGHAFGVVIEGLNASAGHFEPAYIREVTEAVRARSEHVSDHRGVAQGEAVAVRSALKGAADEKAAAMRAQLLVALQGMAPYAMRAMELGVMDDSVDVALARGLSALGNAELDVKELHGLLAQVSEAAATVLTMAL